MTVVTCFHGKTPRADVLGEPLRACATKTVTEYGAFNDEGCWYADYCAVDVANEVAREIEEEDLAADPYGPTWARICPDHEGQRQGSCEDCNAEYSEDES